MPASQKICRISMGILAYNEAETIGKMLNSLWQQNLFQKPESNLEIEIIIVPNGCSDNTAKVAQSTLDSLPQIANLHWRVCEVKQPGKSNAWNLYVHQLSNPQADYLFLIDADIQLLESQTLHSMLHTLATTPEAWVSVDKPIKDVSFQEKKSFRERLSMLVSSLSRSEIKPGNAAWLCGQLYCAKAKLLRKIWLPTHLPTQDAFLYNMIVTDCLATSKVPERVILAPNASHLFEAYTSIYRLLRHEKWLILGNTINQLLCKELSTYNQQATSILIKYKNQQDPSWLSKILKNSILNRDWWLIPRYILLRRFHSLYHKNLVQRITLFPLACAATIIDLILSFQANLELHQEKNIGYWGK